MDIKSALIAKLCSLPPHQSLWGKTTWKHRCSTYTHIPVWGTFWLSETAKTMRQMHVWSFFSVFFLTHISQILASGGPCARIGLRRPSGGPPRGLQEASGGPCGVEQHACTTRRRPKEPWYRAIGRSHSLRVILFCRRQQRRRRRGDTGQRLAMCPLESSWLLAVGLGAWSWEKIDERLYLVPVRSKIMPQQRAIYRFLPTTAGAFGQRDSRYRHLYLTHSA